MKVCIHIFITIYVPIIFSYSIFLRRGDGIQNQISSSRYNRINYLQEHRRKSENIIQNQTEYSFTRLETTAQPLHYKILLKPSLKTFDFEGDETIAIVINKKTDFLTLNSLNLQIYSISMKTQEGKEYSKLNFIYLINIEQINIYLPETLYKGIINLKIKFYAKFSGNLFGLYRSYYHDSRNNEKYLASTQFSSTYARKVFPCFDEPEYKAIFEISLYIDRNLTALSNEDINNIQYMDGGKMIVHFKPTILMSSYLVAIVIGELEYIEGYSKNGTRIRVYTVSGKAYQGYFALETGIKCLDYFDEYFDLKYPSTKVDMIAIPQFNFLAMENTGLITYKTNHLLLDSRINNSWKNITRISTTVAHEIVHQWFGNIVTIARWDQIWLKEGFATYFQYEAIDKIHPEFNIWQKYLDRIADMIHSDSRISTHPLEIPKNDKKSLLKIFGLLSYIKGCAVVRMVSDYVGEKNFRKSIQLYIKKYAYKIAVTEDLWDTFKEVTGERLHEMMDSWTKQPGHPIVTVSQEIQGNRRILHFKQRRFFYGRPNNDNKQLWVIPITYQFVSTGNRKHLFVMKNREESFVIDDIGPSETIVINPDFMGFYRVEYSKEMFSQINTASMNGRLTNLTAISLKKGLLT